MNTPVEEYARKLFESFRISASLYEWKDNEILNLIYLLIADRALHENFIEDLYKQIKLAKEVAFESQFYEEPEDDSKI